MVERVGDDRIVWPKQRLEDAAVGVEGRGEQDGVVLAQEPRERALELAVQILCAADEAHRRHAETVGIERAVRGSDDLRVIGKPQIVIGAQIEQGAAGAVGLDLDAWSLRRDDQALPFE